jgi:hypothetical protein
MEVTEVPSTASSSANQHDVDLIEGGRHKKQRKLQNKTIKCTGCSIGNDAEFVHPFLSVPICGACFSSIQDKAFNTDEDGQQLRCIWCGDGDGPELFMCDSCPLSYCVDCITRNFGIKETNRVRPLKTWYCYLCLSNRDEENSVSSSATSASTTTPSAATRLKGKSLLDKLRISDEVSLINIEVAYASIRPPQVERNDLTNTPPSTILQTLSAGEQAVLQLFTDAVGCPLFSHINIADFLTARDLPSLRRLSRNLRMSFEHILLFPGASLYFPTTRHLICFVNVLLCTVFPALFHNIKILSHAPFYSI